jgi:FAD/FMN-containing dehydrogenase
VSSPVDPHARTCIVEPGIVLDALNQQLAAHGLRYGPEPATHPNCHARWDDRQ